MSRFTTVKAHAKFQEKHEVSSSLPQDLYLEICTAKGDAFGFAQVNAFDASRLEIPFWEWLNYLEDDLCLVLKN